MNLLTRMDMTIGGCLEKVFSHGRRLQPVDLARLLLRTAMAAELKTLQKTYLPNVYSIEVGPEDAERWRHVEQQVVEDLRQVLQDYIDRHELHLIGPLDLQLHAAERSNSVQVTIRTHFTRSGGHGTLGQV